MKRWGLRHRGFKVGFIGVLVCTVFFIIGFAAPAWRNTTGLWMSCIESHKLCVAHHNSGAVFPAWFDVVRIFECLALVAMLLSLVEELYLDFLNHPSPDRRWSEILILIAGTLGLVGCILFASFTPITRTRSAFRENVYLSWGFGLSTASSSFLIAFASVIAYFRYKVAHLLDYRASDSMHYSASDDRATPVGPTSVDLAPPPYSEVVCQPVAQPGGSQGVPGPQSPEYMYIKPSGPPDSQPPPAYFPPPSGEQFQAPPPYACAQNFLPPPVSTQGPSGVTSAGPTVQIPIPENSSSVGVANNGMGVANPAVGGVSSGMGVANPAMSHPEGVEVRDALTDSSAAVPSHSFPAESESSLPAQIPAYYVTVLGQAVPVYLEELQQAGHAIPSSTVPAYFIVTHGQHVPVYSEEQARAFNI